VWLGFTPGLAPLGRKLPLFVVGVFQKLLQPQDLFGPTEVPVVAHLAPMVLSLFRQLVDSEHLFCIIHMLSDE
jgi:hypothetical protein